MKKTSFLIVLLSLHLNLFSQETKQMLTNSAFDYVQKKEFNKAIDCYSQLIQNDPKDSYSYFDRGLTKIKIDDYNGAIDDFSKAIEIESSESDYYQYRAKMKMKMKRYSDAILDLNKAIELEPTNSNLYYFRGLSNVALKKYKSGITDYSTAIEKRNDNIEAYSDRANLKIKQGNLKGALSDFNKIIQINSSNEEAFINRANLKMKLKNYKEALKDCEQTLKLNSNNGKARKLLEKLKKIGFKSDIFSLNKEIKIEGRAQGTTYHIVYIDSKERNFINEIDALLKDFDLSVSTYNPNSIISKVNINQEVVVDNYFITCFNKAKEVWKNSDGAFDPTVAPLTNLWGFGPAKKTTIEKPKIDSILQFVGFNLIELKGNRIIKKDPRVSLDFNAFAQGYSVDVVSDFLNKKGIKSYSVEIGGEVFAKGTDSNGKIWTIGIEQPFDNKESLNPIKAIVTLKDRALSTSGNNRRYVIIDGIKYAHHLDPKTGYPAKNNLLSASVIAKDCISSDANATGILVMGLDKAKIFLANHPELQAYLTYSDDKGNYQYYQTPEIHSIIKEIDEK